MRTLISFPSIKQSLMPNLAITSPLQKFSNTQSTVIAMDDEKEDELAHDWTKLTYDCLINILSRLSLEERWQRVMYVCKPWNKACKDPYLNSVLNLDAHFDSRTELPRSWSDKFEGRIDHMLRSFVAWSGCSLTEIRLRNCSDFSLSLVAQRCPNIQVLSIKSCPGVTDGKLIEIASKCPMIKELDVSYCYKIYHTSLAKIGSSCSNMQILRRNLGPSQDMGIVPKGYLSACPLEGDLEADAISKSMPHLLRLELRFSNLTAKGIAHISEGCLNLEYIDLRGCTKVTSHDIENLESNVKNLKHIKRYNSYSYIPRLDHVNLWDE